jgi:multidrug resistance efflux pump
MENKVIEKTESEKAKDKAKNKNLILIVVAILGLVGIGIWYYFYWESNNYFSTENAKVNTQMYSVSSTSSGKLVKYTVELGSNVKENEVIGRVENGAYLKSPINGQVVKSNATLNQVVSPAIPVVVIADTDNIYVGANIEETDITKIKEGQEVTVELDAYAGKKFKAHVSEIDKTTQTAVTGSATSFSTSGTYTKVTQLIPIKIKLDDVNLVGLIGTNATVKIKIR